MADQSHLDARYFIDRNVYNCPFCNRRNVAYRITGQVVFDWTDSKKCTVVFLVCTSCGNSSMHLSHRQKDKLLTIFDGKWWFAEYQPKKHILTW
jgi:hypothetical protein